jgi:ATP-dependent Lhr-like helicase
VYEARTGQTFMLGASTWRIEDITRDRVIVSPAPGAPGAIPFWRGEGPGRPFEVGVAVGRMARELAGATPEAAAARLRQDAAFDANAARNLVVHVADQEASTGVVPSDRAIVLERFRDEIGDWRLCVLSPFGARIHAPWALALQARLREATGGEAHVLWSDDGIIAHLPDADAAPPGEVALIPPDEIEELVIGEVASTALFGSRFRENAARALLIPRRRPGQRTPLWQQRLRASALLQVARNYGSFPVILETYRECLDDWFDLPALRDLSKRIASGDIALVEVETQTPSPFASALLFDYVATYMYEDDTPAAERRAQALALDRDLLRELLGQDELRDLIDPDALSDVEADLQHRSERTRARSSDELHDVLRRVGDLTAEEAAERVQDPAQVARLLDEIVADRRACWLRVGGEERVIAAEDAARYRDGIGAMPPSGLPDAFLAPVEDALQGLLGRYARSHGPFRTEEAAARLGVSEEAARACLAQLEAEGRLVRGELRPGGDGREWCEIDVLRRLRRASLAALRREVEPVDAQALGRFLPAWQRIDRPGPAPGPEALREVLGPLQGLALPAGQWEAETFPRRIGAYSASWLDALATAGDVVWVGAGSSGIGGGRVALYFRDEAALIGPPGADDPPEGEPHEALRVALASGAAFWDELVRAVEAPREEIFAALWGLVWSGEVTNDLFAPLRAPRRLPPLGRESQSRSVRRRSGRRRGAASATSGRWSLTGRLFAEPVADEDRRRARAELLLERHGVVTRGAARADGTPGGFAGVYRELSDLETLGSCRRGYFVDGLGGAQFALPAAVERLRELRDPGPDATGGRAVVIGASDPAQPYGAAVPWPKASSGRAPARVFGAQAVLVSGIPVLYLERGGRSLLTVGEPDPDAIEEAVEGLAAWITADPSRRVLIERVDGQPARESPLSDALAAAGFRTDLRGLLLRA